MAREPRSDRHQQQDEYVHALILPRVAAGRDTSWLTGGQGSEVTSTGVVMVSTNEPLPTWPKLSAPQHLAPPLETTAQEWNPPAATPETPLDRPDTATAVVLLVVVPSPRAPLMLRPQHFAPPDVVVTHEWLALEAIATAPAKPVTATGEFRLTVVPSPN